MSYFIKTQSEFQNELGKYYRIVIYDDDITQDFSNVFKSSKRGFDLSYETDDRTRFTGLIPSNVKFDIVSDMFHENIIEQIKNAEYGRFLVRIDQSDDGVSYSRYWAGNILSDVSSTPNLDKNQHPIATFTATDGLAELVDVKLDDNTTYASLNTLTPFVDIILSSLKNDLDSSRFWDSSGTAHRFLRTMVNWYTSNMPGPANNRDPLRQSGCIFRAFKKEENGEEVTISSYEALDRICKAWGARLFLSEGKWNFIQNNAYTQMASGGGQFRRDYLKTDNTIDGSGAVDFTYSVSNVLTGGTFDSLPPIQSIDVPYNFLHELDFISIPYVLWNTWVKGEVPDWGSPSATMHRTAATELDREIGPVSAQTNARIEWNLKFRPKWFGNANSDPNENWSPPSGYNALATQINSYLKLIGDSGKHYYLGISGSSSSLAYTGSTSVGQYEWIESGTTASPSIPAQVQFNQKKICVGGFLDYRDWDKFPSGDNVTEISGQSSSGFGGSGGSALAAIPEDGILHFVSYGRFFWQHIYYFTNSTIQFVSGIMLPSGATSASTPTGIDGLGLGLPLINDQSQFLRYVVDGEGTSINVFTATQGTTVSNTILETEEVFLGTGPTAGANTKVIVITNTSTGVLTPTTFDAGITATWQVYQQTTGDGVTGTFTKILGKEILAGRKTPCDIFNGAIRDKDYEYFNAITNIDGSKIFVPQQMTFNAETGVWTGQWIEAKVDITAQAYSTSQIPNSTPPTSSSQTY